MTIMVSERDGLVTGKSVAKSKRIAGGKYLDTKGEIAIWNGKSWKCEHSRVRSQCKECGGASICEHSRVRSQCKDCGGASICQHDRIRSQCKECGGTSICEHSRVRSQCKECGGASICEHNRLASQCKECKVSRSLTDVLAIATPSSIVVPVPWTDAFAVVDASDVASGDAADDTATSFGFSALAPLSL